MDMMPTELVRNQILLIQIIIIFGII